MSNLARLDQAERRNITMRNAVLQIGEMNGSLQIIEQLTVVMRPCECAGCGFADRERGRISNRHFVPVIAVGLVFCWLLAALCFSGPHTPLVAGPVLVFVAVLTLGVAHLLACDTDSPDEI